MALAILIIVWFATFAMTVQLGLWNNTILLAQILLAGLVGFGFYQPLAILMDEATGGSYTYFMDILAIWALYCVTMLVLKVLDGALSKKRVRFQARVDQFGGPVVGLVCGWVMAGIVVASLHAAPVPPETISVEKGDVASASRLTSPDLAWLDLVESVSQSGAFGSGAAAFSAKDYVGLYAARREAFAEEKSSIVRRSGAARGKGFGSGG